jgi:hypothetical protein
MLSRIDGGMATITDPTADWQPRTSPPGRRARRPGATAPASEQLTGAAAGAQPMLAITCLTIV